MENLVLAVDVPENSVSGSTFHVALENRFFEVTVPEGVIPGQTINIIVPQNASVDDASVFQSVEAVREAAITQAKLLNETYKITDKVKQLDETYKVTERASAISAQAIAKVQEYDAKYDITSKVNSYLSTSINKTKEIDQTFQVATSPTLLAILPIPITPFISFLGFLIVFFLSCCVVFSSPPRLWSSVNVLSPLPVKLTPSSLCPPPLPVSLSWVRCPITNLNHILSLPVSSILTT